MYYKDEERFDQAIIAIDRLSEAVNKLTKLLEEELSERSNNDEICQS